MAIKREARIDVIAETKRYQAEMAKLPGFTEKKAASAAVAFTKQWQKAQIKAAADARKAADSAGKAWKDVFTGQLAADIARDATQAILEYAGAVNEARAEQIALSEATGIGLETLAGVGEAARRTGIDAQEITGAFEDFSEVMFDFALNGGGRAAEAFELVGFTAEEMRGRLDDVDGVLRETIENMGDLEDGALKGAAGQQLFGDASNRLNAALGDGALEQYIDHARIAGTVIDEEAVRATKEWTAATGDLQAVLGATGADLVDFLDVAPKIEAFTVGFIFAREVIAGIGEEIASSLSKQARAISEIAQGNFANAAALLESATGLDALDTAYENITFRAARAAGEFVRSKDAIEETGKAATGATRGIDDLSEAQRQAADAANKAAQAEAKLARQREKQQQELEKAAASLETLFRDANEDRLTDLDKVDQALDDELRKLREIEMVLGESAATELARTELMERASRDRAALRDEALAEQLEAEQEFADDVAELMRGLDELDEQFARERQERLREGIQMAQSLFSDLSGAVSDIIGMQLDQAARLEAGLSDGVDAQIEKREELTKAIGDATDEGERRQLEAQRTVLDGQIEADEEALNTKRAELTRIFYAQQDFATGLAVINGAGAILAGFAQLGPIAGAIAAVGTAVVTGVQIAKIQSQQPPQFHTGFGGASPQFTRGGDEFQATLTAGESVNNPRTTAALGGPAAVDRMNNGAPASGGARTFVLQVSGREMGRVVLDEADAGRELSRGLDRRMAGNSSGIRSVYST